MKKFTSIIFIILFEIVVIYVFYLYSLRSNLVPWGDNLDDGLYFLAYFFYCLPLMILLSILKIIFWKAKETGFSKFSYVFYTLVIFIPSLSSGGSQIALNTGMITCLIISILNVLEVFPIINCRLLSRKQKMS